MQHSQSDLYSSPGCPNNTGTVPVILGQFQFLDCVTASRSMQSSACYLLKLHINDQVLIMREPAVSCCKNIKIIHFFHSLLTKIFRGIKIPRTLRQAFGR